MSLFQSLFIVLVLVVLSSVIKRFQKRQISLVSTLFWGIFWILVGVVVILPDSATLVANRLGIGRGADFVIYVALAGLFVLVFRLYIKMSMIEQSITEIVRQETLSAIQKNPPISDRWE